MVLESLPPLVMACVALAAATLWQLCGAMTLLRLVPGPLPTAWRVAIAWLAWLPVSGAVTMALSLTGVLTRGLLLAGTLVVIATAALSRHSRRVASDAWSALDGLRATASPWERWLLRAAVVVQAITALFAAHPQRIYDQLNYHLLVGKLLVRDGQVFSGALDPHVVFAGPVEHALAWHHAWTDSALVFNALAQSAIFVATVPLVCLVGVLVARRGLAVVGLLLVGIPGVVAENVIFRMAKPDGVVFVGVAVLLGVSTQPGAFVPALIGIGAMLMACKLTAVHACIALAACILVAASRRVDARGWLPLMVIGVGALALQLIKNQLHFGNPLYPGAASMFPSWASDTWTADYWRKVAFPSDEPVPARWLGMFWLLARGPVIAVWVAVAAFAVWRGRGPLSSSILVRTCLLFIAAYWLTWPIFYGSTVFPRFVSASSAGWLLLFLAMLPSIAPAHWRNVVIACAVSALTVCGLDWALLNMTRWNRGNAREAYAAIWPRFTTAQALNPRLQPDDTIVADKPDKYHFNARLLYEAPLSPKERTMLAELREHPLQAARMHRVRAVIVDRSRPMEPGVQAIWDGLRPHGSVEEVGPDRVLWSPCHFQPACPPQHR